MMPIFKTLVAAVLGIAFITIAAPASADICHRQNLVGHWVNPDAGPGEIKQVVIRYRCNVARSVRWSIRASHVRADGHEIWFDARTGRILDEEDTDTPHRLGGEWGGTDYNCRRPVGPESNRFWHVIATWNTSGLHVTYRGARCRGGRFQRHSTLQRL